MKRAAVPSILVAVVLLAVGVIAEAQQPKKVPRIGYPKYFSVPLSRSAPRHSGMVFVSLAMLRGKTLSLSSDLLMENSIAFQRLLPS